MDLGRCLAFAHAGEERRNNQLASLLLGTRIAIGSLMDKEGIKVFKDLIQGLLGEPILRLKLPVIAEGRKMEKEEGKKDG